MLQKTNSTQDCFGKEGLQKAFNHALENDKFVGGWHNEDNELYYFDSVKIFADKNEAINFAKANKQLAIFDIENKEVIPTL